MDVGDVRVISTRMGGVVSHFVEENAVRSVRRWPICVGRHIRIYISRSSSSIIGANVSNKLDLSIGSLTKGWKTRLVLAVWESTTWPAVGVDDDCERKRRMGVKGSDQWSPLVAADNVAGIDVEREEDACGTNSFGDEHGELKSSIATTWQLL